MQRPTSQLGHHLLTRSDLAAMAVRATEVFRWLADGSIERVGDLPRAADDPDPVFAVNSAALRADLVARLAGIGKSPVVLTPLGVRSFLLRTMLLGKGAGEGHEAERAARELVAALDAMTPDAAAPPPDAAGVESAADVEGVDADVAEHLMETDLAAVLQDALQEVAPDVEAMLQLAAEIAAAESAVVDDEPWAGPDEHVAEEPPETPATSTTDETDEPEVEFDHGDFDEDEHGDEDLDACFDLDELTRLDAATHELPDQPEFVTDTRASQEEAAMNEEFEAPHEDLDAGVPEATTAAESTSPEPNFEQLFEPEAEQVEELSQAPEAADVDDAAVEQAFDEVIEAVADTIESSTDPIDAAAALDATVHADVADEPADEQSIESVDEQVVEPTEEPVDESATAEAPLDAVETASLDEVFAAMEAEAEPVATTLPEPVEEPVVDDTAAEQAFDEVIEAVADTIESSTDPLDAAAALDATVHQDVADEPAVESVDEHVVEPTEEPVDESATAEAPLDAVETASLDEVFAAMETEAEPVATTLPEHGPSEAAVAVGIDAQPSGPELTAEEPQIVNEAQTEEEAAIESPVDDGVEASPHDLEGSAEDLLAQAMATVEAEQASTTAEATEEMAVEAPLPAIAADEPAFDEGPIDAVIEAVEAQVAGATEAVGDEFALTSQAMDKVQDFLGELRGALVEMAQRPQQQASAPSIDVAPLIQAVQAGFDRSAEQATQASTALASLAERVGQFGQQVEASVQQSVQALAAQQQHLQEAHASAPAAVADRPRFVVQRPGRQTLVLGAVAILVVCWSILFWFKTGSPRLAFGTLIGANLVGCCLLVARRD